MAIDRFETFSASRDQSPPDGFAITPNDGVDLANVTEYIDVGVAGTVIAITEGGTTLTFLNRQSGSRIVGRFKRVMATGTTATNLIGMF